MKKLKRAQKSGWKSENRSHFKCIHPKKLCWIFSILELISFDSSEEAQNIFLNEMKTRIFEILKLEKSSQKTSLLSLFLWVADFGKDFIRIELFEKIKTAIFLNDNLTDEFR
jgi:hypothetical protein